MSLDYQKTVYRGTSGDTLKRTTYSKMMQWRDFVEPSPINPFIGAYVVDFKAITPNKNTPRPPVSPPSCRQEKIPVPPPSEVQKAIPKTIPQGATLAKTVPQQTTPRDTIPNRLSQPVKQYNTTIEGQYLTGEPAHGFSPHCSHGDGIKYRKLVIPATETGRTLRGKNGFNMENVESAPAHLNYHKSGGYDDFHKSYLKLQSSGVTPSFPQFGPPKLRNGRMGGGWRHLREVLQAGGNRIVFVEGHPRIDDNTRLVDGTIPAGNIIQRTKRNKTPVNEIERLKMAAYDNYLTGLKGMERNNWTLIR